MADKDLPEMAAPTAAIPNPTAIVHAGLSALGASKMIPPLAVDPQRILTVRKACYLIRLTGMTSPASILKPKSAAD